MKSNIRIYVVESYEEMSRQAANIVASQVLLNPTSVLGLATGGTPVGMYEELVKKHKEGTLNFSEVTTFNLDEYYPISGDNNQSYCYYMNENLFNHINVDKDNIHIPNGMAEDIETECEEYEEMIQKAGGIDLQVLGIGPNGHIGFNEPDVKFEAGTHKVKLDQHTIEANARFFDSIKDVPTEAISMGIKTIMQARKILLLANGEGKAEIVKNMILGDISPNLPASILQLHGDVTVIIDKEAAKELKKHQKIATY